MRHSLTPDEGLLGSQLLDTGHNLCSYHLYGAAHMISTTQQYATTKYSYHSDVCVSAMIFFGCFPFSLMKTWLIESPPPLKCDAQLLVRGVRVLALCTAWPFADEKKDTPSPLYQSTNALLPSSMGACRGTQSRIGHLQIHIICVQ